jgi:hydrogenase expression/formation protein HypC
MQVIEAGPCWAWCQGPGDPTQVDTRLLGEQRPGTWLLVFQGAAREVLSEDRARLVLDALAALSAAAAGEPFDHLFADLVGREPQLPEFLRKA